MKRSDADNKFDAAAKQNYPPWLYTGKAGCAGNGERLMSCFTLKSVLFKILLTIAVFGIATLLSPPL